MHKVKYAHYHDLLKLISLKYSDAKNDIIIDEKNHLNLPMLEYTRICLPNVYKQRCQMSK